MKVNHHSIIITLFSIVLLLGLTACMTTPQAARIEKHAALFDSLPEEVKKEVTRGSIAKGYTSDMVFLALGAPDEIESAADGQSFVWTYRNFYPSAEVVSDSLYHIPSRNSLRETFEMWRHNQSRYDQLTMDPHERKQEGESWSGYAERHSADSSLRSPRETKPANVRDGDRPGIELMVEAMRLDVIFNRKVVSDAFINETISAFTPQPEPAS